MTSIEELEEKWTEFSKRYDEKVLPCGQCGKKMKYKYMNKHYWLKHPIWMFCRRTGIHWWLYKLASKND